MAGYPGLSLGDLLDMTRGQQLQLREQLVSPAVLRFRTQAEYQAWLTRSSLS